jgi:hypothetical protein
VIDPADQVDCGSGVGDPPAAFSAEFYFGSAMPDVAGPDAILDDGTGFAAGRDGLSYGWDCEGDTDVNYSGGRRGTNRDSGLGMNHFDRSGTCGTTADPGRVNWSLEVPNGECTINVDFGESVVRADLGNSEVHCEVEGQMVCDEGTLGYQSTDPNHCVVTNDVVTVDDGRITVTGYSHDTGRCHSISMVMVSCQGGGQGSGLVGDVNGDCTVDVSDLLVLLSAFGNSAGGDIDGDGTTSVADLLLLLAGFGGTC